MYETAINTKEEINLDLTKVEENLLKRKSRVAFEQEVWRVFCQEMTMSHETNSVIECRTYGLKGKTVSVYFR